MQSILGAAVQSLLGPLSISPMSLPPGVVGITLRVSRCRWSCVLNPQPASPPRLDWAGLLRRTFEFDVDPAALKLIHLGGVKLIHPKLNNQTTAS